MPPILYLSPGQAETRRHALAALNKSWQSGLLGAAQLLLPSGEAIHEMQRFLGDRLGLRFTQFYGLGRWVLDQAGSYPVEAVDVLTTGLVRSLLRKMQAQGQLTSFSSVWDKRGFIHLLVEWIREMKSQGILVEQVREHALASGKQRDRQLADLYQGYQSFLLERELSDADGLLWLAAEALERNPDLACSEGPFIVLGFDHFNPLQLRILKQLALRCTDFSIYLLWDSAREPNSLALYRLNQTREEISRHLYPKVVFLEEGDEQVQIIKHLKSSVFEHGAGKFTCTSQPSFRAVNAPSREAEMRYALRHVKGLLLEGAAPQDIALLAPSPATYLPLAQAVAEEYGIPVQLEQLLGENPAVRTLALVLSLAPDFPRRETLDALRSPYIRQEWLSADQIELLDRLSRERPVVRGKDQWHYALRPLEPGEPGYDEDERSSPQLARSLGAETLTDLWEGLNAFFTHLSAPLLASYHEYALWIQEAVLGLFTAEEETEGEKEVEPRPSLHLADCCRAYEIYAARDLQALALALGKLRELVEAGLVLAPLYSEPHSQSPRQGREGETDQLPGSQNLIVWEAFRDELLDLLTYASLPPEHSRPGVRFGPLNAARDSTCEHLFVLGLSEGEFPHPPSPDVFYSLQERGQHPLPLRKADPAEDASLWWQVIGTALKSLTLLRPRLDENGATWLPSPFWVALLELVEGMTEGEIPIAASPTIEQAACQSELLVALASSGAPAVPIPLQASWERALRCHAVTSERLSWGQPGIYEGFLSSPDLIEELADRFGPRHTWSASRLNRYGSCPFSFFAEIVLSLEAQPDPAEGIDAMQQGSLMHALLERTFTGLVKAGLSLTPSNMERVLEQLEFACQDLFRSAPQRYGFRPGSLWTYEQSELKRQLETYLRWECEVGGGGSMEAQARFWPYRQEATFGMPGSRIPALVLEDIDGSQYKVRGVIDRIDRDELGNLRVIDYKSGSATYSKTDIEKGLACQTALYALAAEPLLPPGARVVESCYMIIPKRETSGELQFEGRVNENETAQAAVDIALNFIRLTRRGEFPSLPAKPGGLSCQNSCDFSGLCRVSRQTIAKARRRAAG